MHHYFRKIVLFSLTMTWTTFFSFSATFLKYFQENKSCSRTVHYCFTWYFVPANQSSIQGNQTSCLCQRRKELPLHSWGPQLYQGGINSDHQNSKYCSSVVYTSLQIKRSSSFTLMSHDDSVNLKRRTLPPSCIASVKVGVSFIYILSKSREAHLYEKASLLEKVWYVGWPG